ncbi:MAG: efflux RND transporter periplasmic adaptor subunit [Chitinivibrionia bacterium]|nr:efflux RND transporter periplasmic adaptor subunit [Chitinivibrionia bacterium]
MKRKVRMMLMLAAGVAVIALSAGYGVRKWSNHKGSASAADSLGDSVSVEAKKAAADASHGKDKKGKKDKKDKKEPEPVPVEISTAAFRRISSFYHTTATLEREREVDIITKSSGDITKLFIEEGSKVASGQLLCQIEDEEQRISFEEARINMEKEEQEHRRIVTMHEQKLISDKEYSDVKYRCELAGNRYEAARLKYEYTKIRAPFNGVITQRFVDEGENVAAGMKLFQIADVSPLLVTMFLPENEIAAIHEGQAVYLSPDNDPGRTYPGKIVRCAPQVDDRTGTVKVTAEVESEGMPGSFMRIKIVTDTHDQCLSIPRRGLVADAGDLFVYIAEADTVRKKAVSVGYQDESYAEVLSGLEPADSVVVVGQGALKTGSKIRILPAGAEAVVAKPDSATHAER